MRVSLFSFYVHKIGKNEYMINITMIFLDMPMDIQFVLVYFVKIQVLHRDKIDSYNESF